MTDSGGGVDQGSGADVLWDSLTEDQRAGMTPDYWENQLTKEARVAFVSTTCVHAGCTEPRWTAVGSYYCEAHTRAIAGGSGR